MEAGMLLVYAFDVLMRFTGNAATETATPL
jgi:hypothetical protein